MWNKNRFIKYFGVIGIFGPVVIFIYYTYIESWLLGYAFFSITGKYMSATTQEAMRDFLSGYQGIKANQYFSSIGYAYFFFMITFILNIAVLYHGIKGGIEKLCRFAMPVLIFTGILLLIRVFTIGTPDLSRPTWNVYNGLGFLWNPDFSALLNAKTWLAASGQIFFTLSVGIGVILTYASYLKKQDDVVLSGLTSVSTNEFVEVIIGGSLIIPLAYAFYGPQEITDIAKSGAFNLGFVTIPLIFEKITFGVVFAFIWFFLLFLAGITSSVSLAQPAVSFLEDEFDIDRKKTVLIFGITTFVLCQPAIFLLGKGVVDELDFWGGTFCLVVFGTVEAILFSWIFGIEKSWEEMHSGADIKIPVFYKFIIKYITPLFLLAILVFWFIQNGIPTITMKNIPAENKIYVLLTRLFLVLFFITLAFAVRYAWRKRTKKYKGTEP